MFIGLRPIGLDFLGASPVRHENPVLRLLDFLGFPWNLSSESGLINGLRGINRQKIFSGLFPVASAHPDGGITLGARRYWIAHGSSFTLISDQQQSIVAEVYPFGRFDPASKRPGLSRP
jgi:hypothetical protein